MERSSAEKKEEEKRAERAHGIIANPSCYWASQCTVPPNPAEKVRPHPSEEGRGSQPFFQVEEREKGVGGRGGGGGGMETDR